MYGIRRDPMGLYRSLMGSIGTLWVTYGIHKAPIILYRGLMGSIGTLWVMYGIHRDPMGPCRDCMEF